MKDDDRYTDKQAAERFEKALRGALSTSPKPLKDIPKAEKPKQKRKPAKASS